MPAFVLSWPIGIERILLGVFALLAVLGPLCVSGERNPGRTVAAATHSAAGLLAVFAADVITLLVAWEILTFAAFFLIRSAKTRAVAAGSNSSRDDTPAAAAYWYVAAQIVGAALFFVAAVVHFSRTGSLAVARLHVDAQPFIVLAVLIKTAMMPLHGWLVSSYTAASPASGIVLSVFTTKVGVLTAARLVDFSILGLPVLTYIGAIVAVVAVVFALTQSSARRLLSFHIVSQVGYMLVGVGLVAGGDSLGVTAGLFHAGNHIVYKALLFTVIAIVSTRLGHDDLRRMGGLARSMPIVFVCCVIGAGAIAGVPFLSGYASKELLKLAAGYTLPSRLLTIATVGTGLSFIKFTYLIFLAPPAHEGLESRDPADAGRVHYALTTTAVVLAALSVVFGVIPGTISGITDHRFFAPAALGAGLWPLGTSVILWVILRRPLVGGLAQHRSYERPVRRLLTRVGPPFLRGLARVHEGQPQTYFGFVVLFAVLLFGALFVAR
ncbi:MAG: hypothetical protein EA426_17670 [Spirochaetaceae bacterium]|nr:MAG: hypothetical protein EA426_17670 [Spirochaetaceae bacterium]